jgi:hypothetical protein
MIPAVLHIENEQPLLADLYRLPEPTDVGLLCTNIRLLNGKRPVFVDDIRSIFFFPYRIIRFIEISPGAMASAEQALPEATGAPATAPEEDLEMDEELLRRVREI